MEEEEPWRVGGLVLAEQISYRISIPLNPGFPCVFLLKCGS